MSYILEALKKSDKERENSVTPGIHSVHGKFPTAGYTPKQGNRRATLLTVAALSLCSAILLFTTLFLFSNKEKVEKVEVQQTTATLNEPESLQPAAENTRQNSPEIHSQVTAPLPVLSADKKKIVLREAPTTRIGELQIVSPLESQQQPDKKESPHLLTFKELPSSIKTSLPQLNIAGHTYSETPSQRMIIINNNILREGGAVTGDLRVVEITWQGIILDYKGTPFSMKL